MQFDIFANAKSIYFRSAQIRYDINPPRPSGHIECVAHIEYRKVYIEKMTVKDVITSDVFREEVQRQMRIEERSQTDAIARLGRLNRTPLDRLRERGDFRVERIIELYTALISKTLLGYSAAERTYINNVCLLAMQRTLQRLEEKEKNSI